MKVKDVNSLKIAVFTDDFPGFQPVFDVCEGDSVEIGSPLMHDKNHPVMRIVSPICGRVKLARRGNGCRVVVNANMRTSYLKYSLKRPFIELLAKSGYLAQIRRIDGSIPFPEDNLCNVVVLRTDVLLPDDAQMAMDPAMQAFRANIKGNLYLPGDTIPASDATAWVIDEFMLYKIGKLLLTGEIDSSTFVTVIGSEILKPMMIHTTVGSDIKAVLAGNLKDSRYRIRIISENIDVNEADGFIRYPYRNVKVVANNPVDEYKPTLRDKLKLLSARLLNFFSR